MTRIAGSSFVALLLTVATACGPELVGGAERGDVKAAMTDEPGASENRAAGRAMSLAPAGGAPQLLPEGTLTVDLSVALLTASGASIPITAGTTTGVVGVAAGDRVDLGLREVEVDVYPRVRITFTRIEAELAAGEGLAPLTVRVQLGSTPLVMEVPLDVAVRKDELSVVELDLNSAIWLPMADPVTGLVPGAAFQAAVDVRVEDD